MNDERKHERRHAATVELLIEVLRKGAPQTIVARGGSMTAAIAHGSRITLAPTARLSKSTSKSKSKSKSKSSQQAAVKLGDVVAVHNEVIVLLVHRVVGIDARGNVFLKGDACPDGDGWFAPSEVVAVVVDVEGRPPPPPTPAPPRWRRALARLTRLARFER